MLKVENLRTYYQLPKPHLFAKAPIVFAVDGVSFAIPRGKTFGLVGESGCGKSTVALSILRLIESTSGSIFLKGIDLLRLQGEEMRRLRRHMQIIFQDPYSSLNPRSKARELVAEPLVVHKIGTSYEQKARVEELLSRVGLRPEQFELYPHQFSGGQRQRIAIARALASNPDFIVCDEPVSSLDVAIQAQILNLLVKLQREFELTFLFISHNLAVVQYICDDIGVMYLGKIVEKATRRLIFKNPVHPYTKALLSAVPAKDLAFKESLTRIKLQGDPPSPMNPPKGCRFHTRCAFAQKVCNEEEPDLKEVTTDHWVACHCNPA
jgi:oligopeptide/dipeptide ABC transporter ATP-binding protein